MQLGGKRLLVKCDKEISEGLKTTKPRRKTIKEPYVHLQPSPLNVSTGFNVTYTLYSEN